jgi:hypothetical protein
MAVKKRADSDKATLMAEIDVVKKELENTKKDLVTT